MNKASNVAMLLCMGMFSTVIAQDEEIPNDSGTTTATACEVSDYKSYELAGPWIVPPCHPVGLQVGPIPVPDDGKTIEDVVVTLTIEHTWIGDLMVEVQYDADGDGNPEASAHPLCRYSLDGCPLEGCCGCGGDLAGEYAFQDGEPSIEDDCPSTFAPGCYGPDHDGNPLAAFSGLPKGGDFYFWFVDGGCGDLGVVSEVGIHILNEGGSTPVEQTSWSEIKSKY